MFESILSADLYLRIISDILEPSEQSTYYGVAPEKRYDSFKGFYERSYQWVDFNHGRIAQMVTDLINSLDTSAITDKCLYELNHKIQDTCDMWRFEEPFSEVIRWFGKGKEMPI